jgi:uncharacterized membrane protein YdbT with pleckstrin-like domain
MSYIERSLGSSEKLIMRAHFHWWYTLKALLALLVLGIFIIGIIIFVDMMVRKWTTEIGVTSTRFVMKTGFFRLRTKEISLSNIEGVNVSESFWGRLLNYGHLEIEGTGVGIVRIPDIADPVGFRRALESAMEATKK